MSNGLSFVPCFMCDVAVLFSSSLKGKSYIKPSLGTLYSPNLAGDFLLDTTILERVT